MLAAVSYLRGILVIVTAVVMIGAFFWWIVRRSPDPADLVMRILIMAGLLVGTDPEAARRHRRHHR